MNLTEICDSVVETAKHKVSNFIQRFWPKRSPYMEKTKEQCQSDSASLPQKLGDPSPEHENRHIDAEMTQAGEQVNETCSQSNLPLDSSIAVASCSSQEIDSGSHVEVKESLVDSLKLSTNVTTDKVLAAPNQPSSKKNPQLSQSSANEKGLQAEEAPSSTAGASSASVIHSSGATGAPGMEMMSKMLAMMSKGSSPAMPGMPDMMSMMMKGGMPNMKDMMSKMQGKGGPGGMMGGPMGMKNLFDCIVEVSLLTPDSDVSDDDEDSITMELPCQYCSRYFSSNMSLKTHILVAHEKEDPSVLNLKKLVIEEKGKGSSRDASTKRKHSREYDKAVAEAASSQSSMTDRTSRASLSSVDSCASQPTARSIKKSRTEKRAIDSLDTSGAATGSYELNPEDTSEHVTFQPKSNPETKSGSCVDSTPPESRKRKALLQMQRSVSSEMQGKKVKNNDKNSDSDCSKQPGKSLVDKKETSPCKGSISYKEALNKKTLKTELREPGRRGIGSRDSDTSKSEASCTNAESETRPLTRRGRLNCAREASAIAVGAAGSAAAAGDSDSSSNLRRSLRNRKSR